MSEEAAELVGAGRRVMGAARAARRPVTRRWTAAALLPPNLNFAWTSVTSTRTPRSPASIRPNGSCPGTTGAVPPLGWKWANCRVSSAALTSGSSSTWATPTSWTAA